MLYQIIEFLGLCRMHRSFVEDDNIPPKIDREFRMAAEKTFRNLARLPDEIALIFMQLLVFAGVIANDNQFYGICGVYFVQAMIIYDGRFQ